MKKIVISLLTLSIVILMTTTVFAATGSIKIQSSSSSVIKGNTFTATLSAESDTNIIGIKGTLDFDSTKLKLVSKLAGNNFTDASSNENEIEIATGATDAKSATLITYTFEVLSTATVGETTISVKNVTLAADTNILDSELTNSTKEITINIKEDSTLPTSVTSEESAVDSSKLTTEDKNVETTKKDTTKKDTKKLPQTGIGVNVLIACIVIGCVGIISYISYRKM